MTFQVDSEDKILLYEDDDFNSFDDSFTTEESEKLASYLTVPHLRIPLILLFFSDSRLGALLNPRLQNLLECILFYPLQYLNVNQMQGFFPILYQYINTSLLLIFKAIITSIRSLMFLSKEF